LPCDGVDHGGAAGGQQKRGKQGDRPKGGTVSPKNIRMKETHGLNLTKHRSEPL
jgi:hypothetical protein